MRQGLFGTIVMGFGKWEGNLLDGGENMSIKCERRFGRNLVETIWQNKHEVGVISISQIIIGDVMLLKET
jgi:hypothetical protein